MSTNHATPAPLRVLVVDDEVDFATALAARLCRRGFVAEAAFSGADALDRISDAPPDVVLLDLKMPGMDGLETLRRLKELSETVAVVIVTAFATTETAIQALKEGAYDYLIKPFKIDELKLVVRKALEERRLRWENQRLRREVELRYTLGNMVGKSAKVQELFSTISRLAESRATVLLTGESGTGKTLLAKTIHFNSSRKNGPFVAVNCAAIPNELMESELFGHVRGAFTGAIANKQGLFETADGGTLLLDEISEMSTHLQAKLLRVLEDREIRPVGGTKPVRVEVRIVAATNRDLAQAMARGVFREDLFYRLNVISVALPSLRERREDIPLLANHFLQKFTELAGAAVKVLSPEALACLEAYAWPGNIRELENVIERAVTLEPGPIIRPESLPESLRHPRTPDAFRVAFPPEGIDLDGLMEQIERDLIRRALERVDGVQSRAAQLLGTGFRSFRYRLQKYGMIERGAGPDGAPDDPVQ
jgi:two-component system response regulator PilR (NtrC family)